MTRYPFAPLAAAMGCSENQAVIRLGISGKQGQEYRHRGLTEKAADRYAVKAGLVPYEVWPDWLDDSTVKASVSCPECEALFLPSRPSQRFCSKVCGRRWRQRRWVRDRFASDPDYAEARRAAARAYHHECRATELTKMRAFRAANKDTIRARQAAYYRANRERILARQREYDRRRRDPQALATSDPQVSNGTVAA